MAGPKKRNSADTGQGTISFARRPRRSESQAAPPGVHKGKANILSAKPALSPRVEEHKSSRAPSAADPTFASAEAVEEILNGVESQALLKELRRDRFEFPRFHQENMPVSQKVLREFDMIQDYGPCQGLTRIQRWKRAERFGKNPPLQVKRILDAAQSRPDYKEDYEMSVFGTLH